MNNAKVFGLALAALLVACEDDPLSVVSDSLPAGADDGSADAAPDSSQPEDGGQTLWPDACLAFKDAEPAPDAVSQGEYYWLFRGDLPRSVWTGTCETEVWASSLCSAAHIGQELHVFNGGTELRGIDEPIMQGDQAIIDNLTDIAEVRGGIRCTNSTETIEVVSVFECRRL